jgi:hypothetical protein
MRSSGQILILLLVLLPLLLLIFGVLSRVGGTALTHDQVENHCDKKVLDALAIQGQTLEELGRINPISRSVIITRRGVDDLIDTGIANIYMPWLISADRALRAIQQGLSLAQKSLKAQGLLRTTLLLNTPSPRKFSGKIKETYQPHIPSFYIEDEEGYRDEVGAPQEPSRDFEEKQIISGKVIIFTEKFLWQWTDFSKKDFRTRLKSKDLAIACKSKITMPRLEDSWTVQLTKP